MRRLQLLKSVSGAFKSGILTALMGDSGAGKTTPLDVLGGRKIGGYIERSFAISGYSNQQGSFTWVSGYCEQTDVHFPYVTVYESLFYSAWLQLPPQVVSDIKKVMVEMPYIFMLVLVYGVIVYLMMGLELAITKIS
ncbi:unnamed protein product [Ilex paraguariensis]|uniref:ABC transporter domain-containing protein n=1 Tax=Ilex paraguariensis TaxID=185542 RepID=A0ABC8QZB7_9AQUA